ncbi:putative ABC transport system permease protein [Anaerobacterium chartisolvens]|uniref:Putative ABC transport system permease protein n=1 Tax=Anaerobacterium chartisolvens TaxID=1297424 RepID=A0A369B3R5_9FIRM|nr:ABC transporter permease [Anaerobacterium chartisolvens]RCX14354.1 putative ABC transport system permease protein [Anaerobacterium chartisolvens]
MRNNNQAVVRKLSKRSFLANKSRNLFALIAIVLTTVLITAVFTIGISLSDGMQQMLIHSYGRSTEVDFQYLTQDEAQRVAEHPLIEEYGLSRLITATTEGVFRQAQGEIHTADENFAEFTFSKPTTGRLPEAENEIALTSWILDAMNLPRELGQTVHLDFEVAGTPYSMDFTVCGFWDIDINLNPYGILYISDTLADKLLAGVNPAETRIVAGYYGTTKLTANIDGKLSELEENVDTILRDTGIDAEVGGVLFNDAYDRAGMDVGIIAAMALIIAIILVSGYLLIYNIFYISVMRDVRFYGLLKTIGATQKQLGRIVNFQALLLCVVGIPVGLLLGYLLGIVLIPVLLGFLSIDYMPAPPNPWIFLLGAALALVTVLISCHGPAKKAGKISPVEAVRYTGLAAATAKKTKRGRDGAKISRMAWSNIFRSRKKASLVIASLSVGLILFNVVYTLVGSFDVNKFLQGHINGDFLIADTDYFSFAKPYTPSYTLGEDLLSDIKELGGVQEVAKVYYANGFVPIEGNMKDGLINSHRKRILAEKPSLSEQEIDEIIEKTDFSAYGDSINAQVYGFDNYWLDKLEENMIEGNFDREKFLSGDYLLLGFDGEGMIQVGDTVTFSLDKDGEKRSYEVMGRVDYSALNSLGAHFISMPGFSVYLPSSEFESLANPNIMSATVIADEAAVDSLQTEIGALLADNPEVDFRSRADYIAEMKSDNQQFALIGFTLCAVILLIGILNFVNTTMTNIFSRKQELAMLQSVGMTAKQSKKMLVLESIYYMSMALLVFVTAGYGVSYFAVNAVTQGSAAYTYQFSFSPLVFCFPILLLLAYALPIRVYKNISKDSVVQRLRENE